MFAIAFFGMVILALVSSTFYLLMRVRLTRVDSARDRIEWLSFRISDDVLATYEALYPRSVLPRFCRFVFWTTIVFAAVILCHTIATLVLARQLANPH
jgi:hypothetical protein